jgi:hypothetical protein
MFTKRELVWILIMIIVLGFIIGFSIKDSFSPFVFIIAALIILTNILAKKLAANFYSVDIENSVWFMERWGFYERSHFKKPVPMGLIVPFVIGFLSLGYFKIMTLLQFDAKPSKTRILRKRGDVRKREVNESDLAFIASWGHYALLLLIILGAIIKSPDLVKYSIFYGFWNLIPISSLDGAKIFFGSVLNWIVLAIIYIVCLIAILLPLLI